MQKIALITDSGCDLTLEQLKEYNVNLLPLELLIPLVNIKIK